MAKYKTNPKTPGVLVAVDEEAEKVLARIEAGESSQGSTGKLFREAHWTKVPGWVRVPVHQADTIMGFKRLGLSDAEAVLAAGGKVAPPDDTSPFGLLRKQLTRVRHNNTDLTD